MTDQTKINETENETLAGLKAEAESTEEKPVTKAEAEAAAEQAAAESAGAEATAHGAMAVVTMVLSTLFPYLQIDPKQQTQVADALAPVFEKYGLHIGGQWKEELTAISAVGTFGFVIFQQMKIHAIEEAEKAKAVEHGKK